MAHVIKNNIAILCGIISILCFIIIILVSSLTHPEAKKFSAFGAGEYDFPYNNTKGYVVLGSESVIEKKFTNKLTKKRWQILVALDFTSSLEQCNKNEWRINGRKVYCPPFSIIIYDNNLDVIFQKKITYDEYIEIKKNPMIVNQYMN